MKRLHRLALAGMMLVFFLIGCGTSSPRAGESQARPEQAAAGERRTLVVATRFEPTDLAPKIITRGGSEAAKRPLNASLALVDGNGTPRPYLADQLPELHSPGWRVFPDGRMETIHSLRSGLSWHDGQPLTADDFVFAYGVYTASGLAGFNSKPQDQIDEVIARDARTFLIRWRSPYPDAGTLTESREADLTPLPRHILAEPFTAFQHDTAAGDTFMNHTYWTAGYVGTGPFRLERWEPGSAIESNAFDGHALGRPKIDRLVMRLIADENTVLTHLLAGTLHLAIPLTMRFEHGVLLKREWSGTDKGVVHFSTGPLVSNIVQFRPELLKTPALLDVRVRRALAHGVDRQVLRENLFDGEGVNPDSFVPPEEPMFAAAAAAVIKYPFDLRRSEQLMAEAGLIRDRDGFFSVSGERFRPEFQVFGGTVFERSQAIMADSWAQAGIQVQPTVLPPVQVRDAEALATFSSLATGVGRGLNGYLPIFATSQIGTRATGWAGRNRPGWSNSEYDGLWEAFHTTLDRSERERQVTQMARLVSDQLPAFPIYFNLDVAAHLAALQGPTTEGGNTTHFWNLHDWELR